MWINFLKWLAAHGIPPVAPLIFLSGVAGACLAVGIMGFVYQNPQTKTEEKEE